jgi:hypothetical protein
VEEGDENQVPPELRIVHVSWRRLCPRGGS